MKKIPLFIFAWNCTLVYAQQDSLPLKISHTEPVYIDLIRDLGARKGEKEWNLGWKIHDEHEYSTQSGFIEYEFAPFNRVGFEVEIPFSYHYSGQQDGVVLPREKIEGIKCAVQYSFLVSKKLNMTLAAGTIFEPELNPLYGIFHHQHIFSSSLLAPFLIAAKRIGKQFHTLLYTGPVFHFVSGEYRSFFQLNLSAHYVIPQTGHAVGLEMNLETGKQQTRSMMHPQVRLKLSSTTVLGISTGIPFQMQHTGLSFMLRLIYEPLSGYHS